MKQFGVLLVASLAACTAVMTHAAGPEQECQQLKKDHNVIYAAQGFCFKDPEAKELNKDCRTTRPKFSDKQQKRLDDIKARQKELGCK